MMKTLPFDQLTAQSRRAFAIAIDGAQRMQHDYLGVGHLLCGLMSEPSTEVAAIFSNFADETIGPWTVRECVEDLLDDPSPGDPIEIDSIAPTPRLMRIVERAIGLASSDGRSRAGTTHLLRALMDDPDSKMPRFSPPRGWISHEWTSV